MTQSASEWLTKDVLFRFRTDLLAPNLALCCIDRASVGLGEGGSAPESFSEIASFWRDGLSFCGAPN